MPPTSWPAKITFAIGTPEARLFFEPQNTMVISSSFEKPRRRLAAVVIARTRARSTRSTTSMVASAGSGVRLHRPVATAWLKAM